MNLIALWVGIITVNSADGDDCALTDGSGVAVTAGDDANCKCGVDDSDAAVLCVKTNNDFCVVSGSGLGECLDLAPEACINDSDDAAIDGASQAKLGCECGDTFCVTDEYCVVVGGVGECLAKDGGAIANCAKEDGSTPATVGCTCGTTTCAKTTNKCFKASDGTGVCLAHDADDPIDCVNQNGTDQNATLNCLCNGGQCLGDKYCDFGSKTCFDSPAYVACAPVKNDHATRCACGKDKVCEVDQSCAEDDSDVGTCTDKEACDDNTSCPGKTCDGTWIDATDTDKYCHKDVAGDYFIVNAAPGDCTVGGSTGACTCTNAYCTSDKYCQSASTCAAIPDDDCASTNGGNVVSGGACKCGSKICADDNVCAIADDGETGECHVDAAAAVTAGINACTKQDGTAANERDTTCACGNKATCAATGGDLVYCLGTGGAEANDGVCLATQCATDGFTASTDACVCGTTQCPATHYCLEIEAANGDKTYHCVLAAIGDEFEAVRDAAVADKTCDTCPDPEECDCDDAGSASCIGSFVTTMATAMNNL